MRLWLALLLGFGSAKSPRIKRGNINSHSGNLNRNQQMTGVLGAESSSRLANSSRSRSSLSSVSSSAGSSATGHTGSRRRKEGSRSNSCCQMATQRYTHIHACPPTHTPDFETEQCQQRTYQAAHRTEHLACSPLPWFPNSAPVAPLALFPWNQMPRLDAGEKDEITMTPRLFFLSYFLSGPKALTGSLRCRTRHAGSRVWPVVGFSRSRRCGG